MAGAAAFASLIALALAPAAQAATAEEAVAALNAQREANGIPGGVAEEPEWSRQCELHMEYLRLNKLTGNGEDPELPGYTPEGQLGGRSSVIAAGDDWRDGVSPWEHAPIRLAALLYPGLSRTGAAPGCMSTTRGYDRPPPAETTFYTYPGPGRSGVPFAEFTAEEPFSPAQLLGLPSPNGPHLYVFPFGGAPQQATGASLIGPGGPVDVRIADATTTDGTRALAGLLPESATMLIPVAPLAPDATYTATVTFASGLTHVWTFATIAAENQMAIKLLPQKSGSLRIVIDTAIAPTDAWVVAPNGRRRPLTLVPRGTSFVGDTIPATPGTWKVCAQSGGPGTGFFAAQACSTIDVDARWSVALSRYGRTLLLNAQQYTRGRRATVTYRRGQRTCGRGGCAVRPVGPITRKVVTLHATSRVVLPTSLGRPRATVLVTVRIAAGRAHGRRVPALRLARTFGPSASAAG